MPRIPIRTSLDELGLFLCFTTQILRFFVILVSIPIQHFPTFSCLRMIVKFSENIIVIVISSSADETLLLLLFIILFGMRVMHLHAANRPISVTFLVLTF